MPPFQQWQIWRLNWPYRDSDVVEVRRGLLLSTSKHFRDTGKLVFCKITTQLHADAPKSFELNEDNPFFKQFGLDETSYVLPKDNYPFDPSEVGDYLGILDATTAQELLAVLVK